MAAALGWGTALSTVLGYGLVDVTSGDLRAAIDATLGFAVATALSSLD